MFSGRTIMWKIEQEGTASTSLRTGSWTSGWAQGKLERSPRGRTRNRGAPAAVAESVGGEGAGSGVDCNASQGAFGHSDLMHHKSAKALAQFDARSGFLRETGLVAEGVRGLRDGGHGESTLRFLSHRPLACSRELSNAISIKVFGPHSDENQGGGVDSVIVDRFPTGSFVNGVPSVDESC